MPSYEIWSKMSLGGRPRHLVPHQQWLSGKFGEKNKGITSAALRSPEP
jgi:hypothetical protein